jgi:pimeloyl-ACP methyl ester carboxylesterase
MQPMRLEHVVDDAERTLDELELERAHLVGNSMGGWVALDLARRGRALTVCALSPAGAWDRDWKDKQRVFKILLRAVRDTRRGRKLLPRLARSRRFRHWALRYVATHGERVSPADFLATAEDVIGFEVRGDVFSSDEQLAPLDPAPCPITLAWSGRDRLFPVDTYGARARSLVPGAEFVVLEELGHVPMFDDPQLVASTILAVTGRSAGAATVAADYR